MLPDTINGLPLHPLSVHATVVLVPLAALLGLIFAVPRLRNWALVPLPLVAVGAAVATWVSTESGELLQRAGGQGAGGIGGPLADLVAEHAELGDQLFTMMVVYAVLAVLGAAVAWRTRNAQGPGPRSESGSSPASTRSTSLAVTVLSVLIVIGAVVVGFQTYRVGDSGARTVWNPTDSVDYSATDD